MCIFIIFSSGWCCTTPCRSCAQSGVLLDSQLWLKEWQSGLEVPLHNLCPYLGFESSRAVTHALVISQLDYCNAFYLGILRKSIWKLHLVQYAMVQIVLKVLRMAMLLHELH